MPKNMCETFCGFCVKFFILLLHFYKLEVGLSRKITEESNIDDKFVQNVPAKTAEDFIAQYKAGRNNEDIFLNITQLIKKYGYPVESHTTKTQDGYILTMFRIPSKGPPVLLVHGLLSSSDDYITAGPESSIGYLLSQDGYDVWLGNVRGNKHSRKHIRLSPDVDQNKFWNFSWDEIGRYDLPAMIDYILKLTNYSKLFYAGHSQGTTSFFVMCSLKPEYNDKIALMIALSPVAFMTNIYCPPIRLILPYFPKYIAALKQANHWEILTDSKIMYNAKRWYCTKGELGDLICSNFIFWLNGFNLPQVNASNMHVILAHSPSGASIKQVEHYYQGVISGKFRRFDYGEQKNLIPYGSKYPPDYPLDKITAPIALFYAEGDYLANVTDVRKLRKLLNSVVDFYLVPDEHFTHVDFIWALDVKKLIYSRIRCLYKSVSDNPEQNFSKIKC